MTTKKAMAHYVVTPNGFAAVDKTEHNALQEFKAAHIKTADHDERFQKTFRVTVEEFDPDIDKSKKFFEGPIKENFAIAMFDKVELTRHELETARETLLHAAYGFEIEVVLEGEKTMVPKRKSLNQLKTVAAYNKLFKLLEETLFEDYGAEFPSSDDFWELCGKYGMTQAKRITADRAWATHQLKMGVHETNETK